MSSYIIRRLLLVIPTLFIVSLIVFFTVRFLPGNIVDAMAFQYMVSGTGQEVMDRAAIEQRLGLDVPVHVQYGRWMGIVPQADGSFSGLFQGDLGKSLWGERTAIKEIAIAWPITFELGIMALIIAQLIALPIGIYSALRQDTGGDYIARSFAILCIALPGFWLGTMVIVLPSIWWGYMLPIFYVPFTEDPIGNLQMFLVPAIVLGMTMSGMTMRMTRTMMLEVLRQDYIRTAWAKGLRERVVIIRHALKNALIPVITVVGLRLPVLIGGTVIIETVFCLPGMGRLIINSVHLRDYPLISAIVIVFGLVMVLSNLIIDLTYVYLDPRVYHR